jgi:hypothetical protein
MSARCTAKSEVTSWEEEPFREIPGAGKLTRASFLQALSGEVHGEMATEMLTYTREDGTASFVALGYVEGGIGERSGSFALQSTGTFDGREARSEAAIVSGSARGELSGLRGRGTALAVAEEHPVGSLTLDHDFE